MSCCSNPAWKNQVKRGVLSKEALAQLPKPPPAAAASTTIDKIFYNGTFLLATPKNSGEAVTAVATAGGSIADVGDYNRIVGEAPNAQLIDLKGTVLSPGFIEPHAHIISATQTAYCIDVGYQACPTYQDVIDTITKAIASATTPPSSPPTKGSPLPWFFFMSYDPSMLAWTSAGFPQLGFLSLDALACSQNCCIFVQNASGHIAYANQNAFTVAGITNPDQAPPGSSYGTDPTTKALNGIMFEPPSFGPFLDNAPKLTASQIIGKMAWFLSEAQQVGVTTVADPAVGIGGDLPAELMVYALLSTGAFATDVVGSIDMTCVYTSEGKGLPAGVVPPEAPGMTGSFGPLVIPNMKLWTDGSTQGYTALLTDPYLPPVTPAGLSPNGEADWTLPELVAMISEARGQNWSMLIHANGDGAIDLAIEALNQQPMKSSGWRDRIEHCTITETSQFQQIAALGASVTFLDNHIYIWGDTLSQHIIGPARAARLDAAADALANGLLISYHCDYSVSMPDPLRFMQTAVTRTTRGGNVLGADQAITSMQALQAVTIWPAQQLGIDDTVGSIAVGKRANFVQLAQDPTVVASTAIASVPVLGTYLHGQWKAGPSAPAPAPKRAPAKSDHEKVAVPRAL